MYSGLNNSLTLDTRRVQLDSSSRCNLRCPGCSRTKWLESGLAGDVRDMKMEHFQALVRPENKLDILSYNLSVSDPIFSGVFIQQLEYINTLESRPRVNISTNGSGRKETWWIKLANLLGPNDAVEFAIDGLEDTNHLYRVNSDWNSIILGIKTLRANWSGRMGWRYVIFEHNYHQVAEAKKLAEQLGMRRFRPVIGDGRTPDAMLLRSKTWEDILNDIS